MEVDRKHGGEGEGGGGREMTDFTPCKVGEER